MSLINFGAGLSAMGSSVAQFAGNAAMTEQKAMLERQQALLADQLATAREHLGRVEAGDIAARAAGVEHEFQSGMEGRRESSTKELEGMRTTSAEKVAGLQLKEANRHNTADELNNAIVPTTNADGEPIFIDKRTVKTSPITGEPTPPAGLINRNPVATPGGKAAAQDVPVHDPVAATDRSPERRPWLSPPPEGTDPGAVPPQAPALVYKGDYIKSLPPEAQARFASLSPAMQLQLGPILSGKTSPPESGRAQTDPHLQRVLRTASLIDPDFDEQAWRERNKAAVDLADTKSPGSSGGQRVAARTFLGHATDLLQAAANKNNTSALGTAGNWVDNALVDHTSPGTPGNSTAKKTVQNKFGIAREGVAEELGKIVSGGAPTVDQRKTISEQFGDNADVSSVVGGVGEAAEMMAKRIQSQVDSYNMTMKTHETLQSWLGPEAYKQYQTLVKIAEDSEGGKKTDVATVKKSLAAIKPGGDEASAEAVPGAGVIIQNGNRFDAKTHQYLGPA
jgi:hypothetical protein